MESWRLVWRAGLAPQLSIAALSALRNALESDDPRLLQGCTTNPPPMACVRDYPCEGACAIGFCGWMGEGLETVGEVEEYFSQRSFDAEHALGEPAAIRGFANWYDETPRTEMRRLLLAEVDAELDRRRQ